MSSRPEDCPKKRPGKLGERILSVKAIANFAFFVFCGLIVVSILECPGSLATSCESLTSCPEDCIILAYW